MTRFIMLTQLTVNNFTIVSALSLDYLKGMTAITGETGAGKSITLDALTFCLGARADIGVIRHGAERAEISAHFILDDTPSALEWLKSMQLDEGNECILRRIINLDGRSKAFINGSPTTLSQLKELGQLLIQIHGQHEHQRLLTPDYQKSLLDHYIDEPQLLTDLKNSYKQLKNAQREHKLLIEQQQDRKARQELLEYQLTELDEFNPQSGEFEQIEEQFKLMSNNESLVRSSNALLDIIDDNAEQNILSQLNHASHLTQEIMEIDGKFNNIVSMLNDAEIQIKEALYEIKNYVSNLSFEPALFDELNSRLSKQIALARKHQVRPELLAECHQNLKSELDGIATQDSEAEHLMRKIVELQNKTRLLAKTLHDKRIKQANTLSQDITHCIQTLSMPHGQFSIAIEWDEKNLNETGADAITFIVNTNPGQTLQPLSKVASGGELSRIALAIQVLTAKKIEMPALVFDEIDVGISGSTAAKVGQLLRELGESTQVISVTHLPQVAGAAHNHYYVEKQTDGKTTETTITHLNESQRINELARLLAGDKITEATIANAKELLI